MNHKKTQKRNPSLNLWQKGLSYYGGVSRLNLEGFSFCCIPFFLKKRWKFDLFYPFYGGKQPRKLIIWLNQIGDVF